MLDVWLGSGALSNLFKRCYLFQSQYFVILNITHALTVMLSSGTRRSSRGTNQNKELMSRSNDHVISITRDTFERSVS